MTDLHQNPQHALWAKIEQEKRTDNLIRRVSKGSWLVTFVFLLGFAGLAGYETYIALDRYRMGAVSIQNIFDALIPFIAVVGGICLVIAILSTVAVFLRLRTSSLSEIQLRLTALEEMIMEGKKTK